MPIFFNLDAHIWIAYALFVNGILALLIGASYAPRLKSSLDSPELLIVLSFFVSVILNALMFGALSNLDPSLESVSIAYALLTLILIIWAVVCLRGWPRPRIGYLDILSLGTARLILYSCVFLILFVNGALIEQISDGWWHLSMANALVWQPNIEDLSTHLTGQSARDYPSLWHVNLATIRLLSQQDIVILFNAITPWAGVVKVMAFYLFAWTLTKDRLVATLSAVLFVCLPGLGASYMRVSAWPSHIAYTAFLMSFYFLFRALEVGSSTVVKSTKPLAYFVSLIRLARIELLWLVLLLMTIWFTHKVELVWFVIAIGSYFTVLLISTRATEIEASWTPALHWLVQAFVVIVLIFSCYLLWSKLPLNALSTDERLMLIVPIVYFAILCGWTSVGLRYNVSAKLKFTLILLIVTSLLLSIDWRHFGSAFWHEWAYPIRSGREWPLIAKGLFGGQLLVPGWHLQLRDGLVPLGLAAVPLAWGLHYFNASRATLFLGVTSSIALLVCVSPYWHTWLREAMNYHSVWRVTLLVFHPVLFALLLITLVRRFTLSRTHLIWAGPLVVLLGASLLMEARFHFSEKTVQVKRENRSPQRHWNLYYDQRFVYYDAGLRYVLDFAKIAPLVQSDAIIISDLPTSYYASARIPGSVINVHRHHQNKRHPGWRELLDRRFLCDATDAERAQEIEKLINTLSKNKPILYLYNRDDQNRNLRFGCEYNRRHIVLPTLKKSAQLVFTGQYLDLYQFTSVQNAE